MKKVIFDIETNGLDPDKLWCIVTYEVDTKETRVWDTPDLFDAFVKTFVPTVDQWIGHNILGFDIPVLNKLLKAKIPDSYPHVFDTFVVSRLVQYVNFTTHSLYELSRTTGQVKTLYTGGWDEYTPVMRDYCIDDVKASVKIWERLKRFGDAKEWQSSLFCEHEIHKICRQMGRDGFYFNGTLAKKVLASVTKEMEAIEKEFQTIFPPQLVEVSHSPLQYQINLDGSEHANVAKAKERYDKVEIKPPHIHCYMWKRFNPGSTKDRIEKLWELGWNPVEKSKTHYEFSLKARPGQRWRSSILTKETYALKKEYFDFYGWTVSDENLATLPEDAPESAHKLAEWLTLNGRKTALIERLQNLSPEDLRIHTNFWHIGSWTHRMAHSNPNLANISSPFHGEPRTGVERVKARYDADMRSMFTVESGYLVGTDAESIQLRILAHYLRNEDYVHAIVSGRKEDQTDIHNLNRKALRLEHLTRDHAKTFIYAWLLGAGTAKVSRILECSTAQAKQSMDSFIENTKGLGELKRGLIKRDALRGFFEGLDGRRVICNSEYYMLAGYLQNGEAVIMKHANILWRDWLDREKIKYKQVNFVHDEWQTQVYDSLDAAHRVGELQCKALKVAGEQLNTFCPMSGETRVGQTWLETH